ALARGTRRTDARRACGSRQTPRVRGLGPRPRSWPGPVPPEVDLEKAMLLHKPPRAAAGDQLRVMVIDGCEEDCQLGMGTRQRVADREAVVVAQAYIQENRLRGLA